jgi:hypothetical protein
MCNQMQRCWPRKLRAVVVERVALQEKRCIMFYVVLAFVFLEQVQLSQKPRRTLG